MEEEVYEAEIVGFSDEFAYDSQNPRIVVTLEEA